MFKKAEGRASSLVIVLILGVSIMVWFSSLVTEMVVSYEVEDAPEFKAYESLQESNKQTYGEISESQDGDVEIKQGETYEDNLFRRAMNTITLFFGTFSLMGGVYNATTSNSRLFVIPSEVSTTILLVMGLTIVVLGVKAFWRFKEV